VLFKVVAKVPVRESNPGIEAIEEFNDISDRNLRYIFLVYDYDSPFKQLPIDERKKKVALHVGFKTEKGRTMLDKNARDIMNDKVEYIQKETKKFKELLFDQDRETFISISELIVNISNFIRVPSKDAGELEKKAKMAQQLTSLTQTRQQLAQILGIRSETIDGQDEKKEEIRLSTLERFNEES